MNDIKEFYNSVALSSLFHKENKRKKILSPCYNYQIIKKKKKIQVCYKFTLKISEIDMNFIRQRIKLLFTKLLV